MLAWIRAKASGQTANAPTIAFKHPTGRVSVELVDVTDIDKKALGREGHLYGRKLWEAVFLESVEGGLAFNDLTQELDGIWRNAKPFLEEVRELKL